MSPTKRCTSCSRVYPPTPEFFPLHKNGREGLYAQCKPCVREKKRRLHHGDDYEAFTAAERERQARVDRGEKRCTICGGLFPISAEFFHRNKRTKDGFHYICKPCASEKSHRQHHGANYDAFQGQKRERLDLRQRGEKRCPKCKQVYPATSEFFIRGSQWTDGFQPYCKHCCRELKRNMSPEQRERDRQRHRRWYENPLNRKRVIQTVRKHDKASKARRSARKKGLPDRFSSADWKRCLDYWGHRCAVCGCTIGFWHTLAADHWIPLTKGGATIPQNIVPLCNIKKDVPSGEPCCNQSKKDKMPLDWLIQRFGQRKAHEILHRIDAYFASL